MNLIRFPLPRVTFYFLTAFQCFLPNLLALNGFYYPFVRRLMYFARDNSLFRRMICNFFPPAIGPCLISYPLYFLYLQIPSYIFGKESIVFGNLGDIYHFHEKFFEPEICKYASGGDFLPEDVGHCFVSFGDRLASLYVDYCVNKEDSMQILVADMAENFFGKLQLRYQLSEPLQSFLIKPVQRITKYQLLLRELRDCCDKSSAGELSEGLDVMMAVPKKANEAIHLRMLQVGLFSLYIHACIYMKIQSFDSLIALGIGFLFNFEFECTLKYHLSEAYSYYGCYFRLRRYLCDRGKFVNYCFTNSSTTV